MKIILRLWYLLLFIPMILGIKYLILGDYKMAAIGFLISLYWIKEIKK